MSSQAIAEMTEANRKINPGNIVAAGELAQAKTPQRAWLSVFGEVWDVTSVLAWHPGGDKVILEAAGRPDATQQFAAYHSRSILESTLGTKAIVGYIEGHARQDIASTSRHVQKFRQWVSVKDAEDEAREKLPETSFGYFATGAEDEITLQANESIFRKMCWFRPRVLRDVAHVDTSVMCFGKRVSSPLFVTSTAIQGLADVDLGELAAFRASKRLNIIHIAAHLASRPWEDYLLDKPQLSNLSQGNGTIALEGSPSENHNALIPRYLQLYLPRNEDELLNLLDRAVHCGFEALFITVDSASIGKRERDVRIRQRVTSQMNIAAGESIQASGTAPRLTSSNRWNESFDWKALQKLMSQTKLPIILKGIQRGDDAVRAVRAGVSGIMISNHGGRNLDTARPTLACLVEVDRALRQAGLKGKVPIFFDGGIRRGSDALKALCLGADFVGVGRPILYGVAARGEEGAVEVMQILHSELVTAMKLVGCTRMDECDDRMVEYGISYL